MRTLFLSLRKYGWSNLALFALVIIGALFVRIVGLGEYEFSDDELWHLSVSNQENLWQLIKYNFIYEIHPPLSYIIWHLALQISDHELWIRMPGIIAGLCLIPSAFLFGKRYIGLYGGYFLAFIFAFSPFLVTMSVVIRAYPFMMLALIWAAIFVHQYCHDSDISVRKKAMIGYGICCFLAIELHHASCFAIASLGFILMYHNIREKNKKDFIIFAIIHGVLLALVLGYVYILKVYFGFEGIDWYFSDKNPLGYLFKYVNVFFIFIAVLEEGRVAEIVSIISLCAFLIIPFILIKRRQFVLLNLIFTPVILLIIADYLNIYPFSSTNRNNLFLVLSLLVGYGYLANMVMTLFLKIFSDFIGIKNVLVLSKMVCYLLVVGSVFYFSNNYFLRHVYDSCKEFTNAKLDRKILNERLNVLNKVGNILVTTPRNMWYWKFFHNGDEHITYISDHLAKFENRGLVIYFESSSPITHSTMYSMYDYKLFFEDLFGHLESNNRLSSVDSITFFDMGLNVDYLTYSFHPQLIPPKKILLNVSDTEQCRRDLDWKWNEESYDTSWVLQNSDQILDRFYHKDIKSSCGREIFTLTFTPKFVTDEILNKDFMNFRQIGEIKKQKCEK